MLNADPEQAMRRPFIHAAVVCAQNVYIAFCYTQRAKGAASDRGVELAPGHEFAVRFCSRVAMQPIF
jgi:hypothetical protein